MDIKNNDDQLTDSLEALAEDINSKAEYISSVSFIKNIRLRFLIKNCIKWLAASGLLFFALSLFCAVCGLVQADRDSFIIALIMFALAVAFLVPQFLYLLKPMREYILQTMVKPVDAKIDCVGVDKGRIVVGRCGIAVCVILLILCIIILNSLNIGEFKFTILVSVLPVLFLFFLRIIMVFFRFLHIRTYRIYLTYIHPKNGLMYKFKSEVIRNDPKHDIEALELTELPVYMDLRYPKRYLVDISKLEFNGEFEVESDDEFDGET